MSSRHFTCNIFKAEHLFFFPALFPSLPSLQWHLHPLSCSSPKPGITLDYVFLFPHVKSGRKDCDLYLLNRSWAYRFISFSPPTIPASASLLLPQLPSLSLYLLSSCLLGLLCVFQTAILVFTFWNVETTQRQQHRQRSPPVGIREEGFWLTARL